VESVIEGHYADQIADLQRDDPALAEELEGFRQDELRHRDLARDSGAREAPGYPVLSALIGLGCRTAIRLSEKL
jgi:ubiquinone biosynthesis monooxygenase Coq7